MLLSLPRYLLGRLYLLAAILTLDCAALASIPHASPLLGPLAPCGIVAFAVFLGLGYRRLEAQRAQIPFRSSFFYAHLACIASVSAANLLGQHGLAPWIAGTPAQWASGAVLVLGVALLALACMPLKAWLRAAAETSPAWQYALAAGVAAWWLRSPFQSLWIHSSAPDTYLLQTIAFRAVQTILGFLLPTLVVDAGPFVIGTPRFMVSIGAPCSGIEGLGLVLVFTTVWLWFFRKENRFPQALLLVPCALVCVFVLNIVRIAVLILIGNAGAPEVAFIGFHSQAGWIAFTLVALGFSVATQKLKWIRKPDGPASPQPAHPFSGAHPKAASASEFAGESPATAPYLLPFLAILGASFLAKSASGHFEWLYPLRFVAALVALWIFRAEYRKLNWRFGWAAPLTGAAIFLIWIAPNLLHPATAPSDLGLALASLPPASRMVWIALRACAAILTVPVAEELAFRGFLARRIMARDFTQVPFVRLTLLAIGVSSVAFSALHGQHWLVGIVAGMAFAALLRRSGRIGDAVVAHAVANLLLAAWVLVRGDFGLW